MWPFRKKTPREKATMYLQDAVYSLVDARKQILQARDKEMGDVLVPIMQLTMDVMRANVLAQAPTDKEREWAERKLARRKS